ncbi:MAG: DUF3102 domain-containing protein [Verrucomicrobiota bacterium]
MTHLELAATERTPLVSEIVALHGEVVTAARTTLDKAIRIGALLTEQKAQLKHGKWLPWVKDNLPFTEDTAQRYMRVYSRRSEIPHDAVFELTDAYRLLSDGKEKTAHVSHNSGDNEWYTPEGLVGADQTTINAIRFLCDSELAEVEGIIASADPETTDEQERVRSIRALVGGRKKALAWRNYWAEYSLRCERGLGQAIIKMRELLSSAPWPELTKLYPWLLRQREKHPEAAALWDKYPDEMAILETARAFHVMDTTGRTP